MTRKIRRVTFELWQPDNVEWALDDLSQNEVADYGVVVYDEIVDEFAPALPSLEPASKLAVYVPTSVLLIANRSTDHDPED